MREVLHEKIKESVLAVSPICAIILLLHFTVAPLESTTLAMMFIGMAMLFVGMILFSIGVELALLPIGEHVGKALIATRKPLLIFTVLFVFGFVVTAAEPDLSVLANQVASIPNLTLIAGISVGVGLFLIVAVLRIMFKWRLARLLALLYPAAFMLAIFSGDYIAIAIDSAAVTTGPVTVPFLLAVGGGIATLSSGKHAEEDNFGFSALCSVGPIVMVLLLGMFHDANDTSYIPSSDHAIGGVGDVLGLIAHSMWDHMVDVVLIIVPIIVIFLIFQIIKLKLSRADLIKIFTGVGYLIVGLTIFLTGVNEGFLPAATALGREMGSLSFNWIVIPIAFVIGAAVLLAEPTAYVLIRRVEEITDGAISRKLVLFGMAAGVGIAMCFAMFRILFNFSIWWILLPGYGIALTLSFFVPGMFVGIGFDSGAVATGALSAAFVLPFAIGVGSAIPGVNVVSASFGIVGLSAMLPPIVVQLMGLIYTIKLKKARKIAAAALELDAAKAEEQSINCAEGSATEGE